MDAIIKDTAMNPKIGDSNNNEGSTRTTARGLLALAAILLFSRIYFIINESKKYRKSIFINVENDPIERMDVEELPYIFAMFLLVLAGMPLLR